MRSRTRSGMPPPVSEIRISAQSSTTRVRTAIVPMPSVPRVTSAMACAAFTTTFSTTWPISSEAHSTSGRSASRSSSRFATRFHSLRDSVSVFSMHRFSSVAAIVRPPGCENSFIARTILFTRSMPSIDCVIASSVSVRRYSRSAPSTSSSNARAASAGSLPAAIDWHRAEARSMTRTQSRNASFRNRVLSPMYCMGVLISWAMPAASWPIDSSFCDWSCSACALASSVCATRSCRWTDTRAFTSPIRNGLVM